MPEVPGSNGLANGLGELVQARLLDFPVGGDFDSAHVGPGEPFDLLDGETTDPDVELYEQAGVSFRAEDGAEVLAISVNDDEGNLTAIGTALLHDRPRAEALVAEIVAAGGVIPMLLKDGYIHAEPFNASSN